MSVMVESGGLVMREGFNGPRKDCGNIVRSRGRLGWLPHMCCIQRMCSWDSGTCVLRLRAAYCPAAAVRQAYLMS
jgi:hypothetical protein